MYIKCGAVKERQTYLEVARKDRERKTKQHRHWERVILHPEENSSSYYLRNPFSKITLQRWWNLANENVSWSQPFNQSNGRKVQIKAAWFVTNKCSCRYSYSGTVWMPTSFPSWLLTITKEVMRHVHVDELQMSLPNSCNINFYENENACVGWHSDDEELFQGKLIKCSIISLSLGASRIFQIKNKRTQIITKKKLHNGDLITMEGMFQKFFQHRVPKSHYLVGGRINFTWRWIEKHEQTCQTSNRKTHRTHSTEKKFDNGRMRKSFATVKNFPIIEVQKQDAK